MHISKLFLYFTEPKTKGIMKKKKFYKVMEIDSDGSLKILEYLPTSSTFETELEALQFISDCEAPFYQLTILSVYE